MGILRHTAYRPSLIFGILGKLGRVGLYLIFADTIFRHIPAFAGWTPQNVPVLVISLFVIELLANITFQRNLLFWFPLRYLRKGQYDFTITKPISVLFFTSFSAGLDFFDTLALIPVLGFFGVFLVAHGVSFMSLLGYSVLMGAAYLICFSFALLCSSLHFWTLIPTGVGRWYTSIQYLNRFPLDVLPQGWRNVVFYIIPIAVAGNIPAKYVVGTWSNAELWYIVGFSVMLFFVARKWWYYALRHYSSAA